jgi:hypothetical protein
MNLVICAIDADDVCFGFPDIQIRR